MFQHFSSRFLTIWFVATLPAAIVFNASTEVVYAKSNKMLSANTVPLDTKGKDFPSGYVNLLNAGTRAYNGEDYRTAANKFVAAIQLAPWIPDAYKNLARSYFFLSDFDTAAYFYDQYLNSKYLDRSNVDDYSDVEKELAMTVSKTSNKRVPSQHPHLSKFQNQYDALQQLINNNDNDPRFAKPWGAYQALLRAKYASSDLVVLRNKLANSIAIFIEGALAPPSGYPTPRYSLEMLQELATRLQELRSVSLSADQIAWSDLQQLIIRTMIAVAVHSTSQSLTYIDSAIKANPALTYLVWYKVAALYDDGQYDKALKVLQSLAIRKSMEKQSIPSSYFDTFIGAIQLAKGQYRESATTYREVLIDSDEK